MEQKDLEHDKVYVDLSHKPQWLLDVNPEGTVPVLKDGEKYIPDSGAIVDYLEDKFPAPAVPQDPEGMDASNGILGAFRNYFLNKDPDQDEELKEALHVELKKLDDRLGAIQGLFLGGATFNAADAFILPRLYHMRVALGHYKQWSLPEEFANVKSYVEKAAETDVWKKCEYSPDLIIKNWGAKL